MPSVSHASNPGREREEKKNTQQACACYSPFVCGQQDLQDNRVPAGRVRRAPVWTVKEKHLDARKKERNDKHACVYAYIYTDVRL